MKKTSANQSKLRLLLYHCTDTVVVVCNNPLYYAATILVNVITLMRLECAFRSPPNAAPRRRLYIVLQTLRSTAATLATLTALATLTETPSFMLKPTLRAGEEADPNCLHLDVQYSIPGMHNWTSLHCTALS